jgi:uncharacterized protein
LQKPWKQAGLALLNMLCVIAVIAAAQPLLHKFVPDWLGGILLALLVILTYTAAAKWIERRTPSELDPPRLLPEIIAGLAIGFLLFACVMAILWVVGVYHPAGRGSISGIGVGLVGALVAAIVEEILFRGLLFRLSSKLVGTWGALILTSAFFGAAHAFNPGASVSSSLAIVLEAGILLGAAYAATQRLWLPIGLHIGWNFTEGSIFSMSISGTGTRTGLILGSLTGPRFLTGGQFGPEASIIAVLVCLAAAVYFLHRIVKFHRTEPPFWKKQPTPELANRI